MAARPGTKLHLPEGISLKEEAEWWDAHADELDWDESEIEVLPPQPVVRTADAHLRLPIWMIDASKKSAENSGFSYQWLIREWLEERLAAEGMTRPQADAAGTTTVGQDAGGSEAAG